MELKLDITSRSLFCSRVLIVPLWNWNLNTAAFVRAKQHGFNRTFMELKYLSRGNRESGESSFNRTFMELKYCRVNNMF